jgi:hypothetical protein
MNQSQCMLCVIAPMTKMLSRRVETLATLMTNTFHVILEKCNVPYIKSDRMIYKQIKIYYKENFYLCCLHCPQQNKGLVFHIRETF